MTAFADELYAKVASIDAPSADLEAYCDAIGEMFAEVEGYVREAGDVGTWQSALDARIANATALLWLAQLAGVRVPIGMDSGDLTTFREFVEAAEGRRRGTPSYMAEVAQRTLTGGKTIAFFERYTDDAYLLHVVTRTDETPDAAATEAALRSVKPAGIVLSYEATDGITWDEPTHTWGAAAPTVTWDDSLTTTP